MTLSISTGRPAAAAPPEIADWVREVAGRQDPRVGATTPVVPLLTYGLPTRPFAANASDVYICAGVALKLHPPLTDPDELATRLKAIADPDVERAWVQPLGYRPFPAPGGRVATLWPRVSVLGTLDPPPWQDAGRLLARVHTLEPKDPLPAAGTVRLIERALTRLRGRRDEPGARWLTEGDGDMSEHSRGLDRPGLATLAGVGERLVARLAEPARSTMVHGDFHLGQLGHTLLRRQWRLLDVDNAGLGDPAWDLATPAAFYAAGLLDSAAWKTFLGSYREAGGPAVPADGDVWAALELPTRAAALVAAVAMLGRVHAEATADSLLAVAFTGER